MKKVNSAFIIDDDDIFIYGTRRVMQELNFCENISVFKNGQEAIDGIKEHIKLGKELPDVILLDINMPIMNGWDFLEELAQTPNLNKNKVLLYLISSSVDPVDIDRAKKIELVTNYFIKPITPKQVKEILKEFFD